MKFNRSSGILLHPTSLPGPFGSGDLGASAYHFIDWLVVAGQKIWQTLPLGPVGMGDSPYMCLSAFAGEPLLIDLEELAKHGWTSQTELHDGPSFQSGKVEFGNVRTFRMTILRKAADVFFGKGTAQDKSDFESFSEKQKVWLDDYSIFMALIQKNNGKEWSSWDPEIAQRTPSAMNAVRRELGAEISFWKFTQWCFYRQWFALKKYANEKGIQIVGDIPIFIAYQSADVWANRHLFHLDKDMKPTHVAGVPPDYFSATGQRWGNPLYRWDKMDQTGYAWWIERIKMTLTLVDIVRIDHFRGFAGYWEIPATEKTAEHGQWVTGPGAKLFDAIKEKLGKLSIIAEDLGVLTPDVIELRDRYNFPGMRILQFAFAGDSTNNFLPHNYTSNTLVYTGTHDNDTTLGWFNSATEREREFVKRYLGTDGKEIHWDLIRLASRSVADIAVFPFQDILGLGTGARMNLPGTALGNWNWRFTWDQVKGWHAERLYEISALSNRTSPDRLTLPAYPNDKAQP